MSFKSIKKKRDGYRGKDCMVKFCNSLGKHAMKIINSRKNKLKLLANEKQNLYEYAKICYISKGNWKMNMLRIKKFVKLSIYREI